MYFIAVYVEIQHMSRFTLCCCFALEIYLYTILHRFYALKMKVKCYLPRILKEICFLAFRNYWRLSRLTSQKEKKTQNECTYDGS